MKTATAFILATTALAQFVAAQESPTAPADGGSPRDPGQQDQGGDAPPAPDVDPNRPNENYPYWVTNDYSCVIECLKPFEAPDIPNPAPDLEGEAYKCVADKCNREWTGNNMYQASYIIQMRYATGSIYEDEKMGEWGQGSPPDKNQDAAKGGGAEGGGPASVDGNKPVESPQATSSAVSSSATIATITTSSATPSSPGNGTAPGENSKAESGARGSTVVTVAALPLTVLVGALSMLLLA